MDFKYDITGLDAMTMYMIVEGMKYLSYIVAGGVLVWLILLAAKPK